MRRGWVLGGMAVLLVLVGGVTVAKERQRAACGASVTSVSAAGSRSPFLDAAGRREQPDEDRDALVAALAADPAPVGEVVGAVGYHYEQWARVSAYAQGIGVRTRDNPDFTMLDDASLKPLWSVRVTTKRSTYDASERSYLVATLPRVSAPEVVAVSATTGRRRWCTRLTDVRVGAGDSVATQFLDGDDVAVLADGRLQRLSGRDGAVRWARTPGKGEYVGDLGNGVLVTGGVAREVLLDRQALARRPAGRALSGVAADDGHTLWTRRTPAGTADSVVGADPSAGVLLVEEAGATGPGRLVALDRDGEESWSLTPPAAFDATIRSGRVLVRAGDTWSAYDVAGGRPLWSFTAPGRPQFLPYGFEIGGVPLLDDDHALIGTTTALRTLDLRDGTMTSAALPTDGISTTYWPYEVAVSTGSIAVATNTGAVVVRREGLP